MSWVNLLPEPGEEPSGLDDQPPAELDRMISRHLAKDRAVAATVRAWPPEVRRLVAARAHLTAVRRGHPDEGTEARLAVLIGGGIRWSRADLAWALRSAAEEGGLYDGGAFFLPAHIALALPAGQLAGFVPALRAVFDHVLHEGSVTGQFRHRLAHLYGTAIGRATGTLPPHLLNDGDEFGPAARSRLSAHDRSAQTLLIYAASLERATPSKAWLRAAPPFVTYPAYEALPTILETFASVRCFVDDDNDVLLRGLTWLLSLDPSDEATGLLARVAVAAGSSAAGNGYVNASRTAAAAVTVLAARPGPQATTALTELDRVVRNKALRKRIEAALGRGE
jgi:hypothetical protein